MNARLRVFNRWAYGGGSFFPRVPAKYESMLICQPPLTEMVATPTCCASFFQYRRAYPDHIPEPPQPIVFSCSTGISVGHLLYVAKQLYARHQYCPYASEHIHDKDGEVHPHVEFTGSIRLNASDPVVQDSSSDYDWQGESPDDYRGRDGRQPTSLERYCEAKKHGK